MKRNSTKIKIILWVVIVILLGRILINGTINSQSTFSFIGIPFENKSFNGKLKENNEYKEKINKIDKIKFDLTVDEIIIKETNEKDIKIIEKSNYKLKEGEKIKIEKHGDKLEIVRHDNKIISPAKNINRCLEIYLPKSYGKNIEINNKVGDITIESNLNLDNLKIKQSVGDFSINSSVKSNEFYVENNTGNIFIKSIDSKTYYVEGNTGDVNIQNISGYGNITSGVGDIDCNIDKVQGDIFVKAGTGDISIGVNKTQSFILDLSYNVGDFKSNLKLNDYVEKDKSLNGKFGKNPSYKLEVICGVGDVHLNEN